MSKELLVLAPVSGKVKTLDQVDDPVFAGEMVGKGFAIEPIKKEKEVFSPVNKGKVSMAFDGGHAYGIQLKPVELLLHIGIDTVGLKGEGFDQKIFTGDKIKKNNTITMIDLDILSKKAKSTDVIIIVTNETLGDWKIERVAKNNVKVGEVLYKLVK